MSNIIRCCFAGHSVLYDRQVVNEIKNTAEQLVTKYGVNEFWVGNYGGFYMYSVSAIRELKKSYPHIIINLVIPYLTGSINEYMVDNCDFLICYIEKSWGGAYRTYMYAKRKKLKIFNLAKGV